MITITKTGFVLQNKRLSINALKWIATIIILTGSSLIPFQFFLAGYTLFLIGESILLPIFIAAKDKPLICLHTAFILVNVLGLVKLGL